MFKKHKNKVFCIGLNKTGTTSIESVLRKFDYDLGDQHKGELYIQDWFNKEFKHIIKFCHSAEAFQDIPFSLPYTYIFLAQYFKNAKFILTERDSAEQWYRSFTKFHSKLWSDGENLPSAEDLKKATYCYRGFAYDALKLIFNTSDDDLYNKKALKDYYLNHNYSVKGYFRNQPENLLVLNVSKKTDYKRLCLYLNKSSIEDDFPWENKTG